MTGKHHHWNRLDSRGMMLLRQYVLLVLAVCCCRCGAEPMVVTLTPWCSNSWRVQAVPASRSPAAEAEAARLGATLRAHGLSDLPAALIDDCGPGAPVQPPAAGQSVVNGNLVVTTQPDSTLRFSLRDTGATLLTTAMSMGEPTFATSCAVGFAAFGNKILQNATMTLADAETWCAAHPKCSAFSAPVQAPCNGAPFLDAAAAVAVTFVSGKTYADGDSAWRTWSKPPAPGGAFQTAVVRAAAGDANERLFGLGQGGWTRDGGCPNGAENGAIVVPLQRNGATLNLQQRKFQVTIPFLYSTAGYGFLFNMPGFGSVSVGEVGTGGATWTASAALGLDFWVTGLANSSEDRSHAAVYRQYADATGHPPPLREDAMRFWQSRNRYKSSAIALGIAQQYAELDLACCVGVLVIDYHNEIVDGNLAPNPACYPSVSALAAGVRALINATVVFSMWPEVKNTSANFALFQAAGCLSNKDLGGYVLDTTIPSCRDLIWGRFLKPNYYDQGVTAFWLDETDGEGTPYGDGEAGYTTSFGPAAAYTNLWVGSYISTFTQPVADLGAVQPLALVRGVWAGGQRHGVVLWSSDIKSSFEQLASMVPQGVHAAMSGIPWWTTDIGGFGCPRRVPDNITYTAELMVRWYQFGVFCPVFRTHGCRHGRAEPDVAPCVNVAGTCGPNEIWSYGNSTQAILDRLVRFRTATLLPYIRKLDANATAYGAPTMRPLMLEFPNDPATYGVNDQFMLGSSILVAPVTTQHARSRMVVFPAGASWQNIFNSSDIVQGGVTLNVSAPLAVIPAYWRR